MKIVVSFVALLLACGTGTVKAQSSTKILKPVSNKQLVALNFIDDISFTPEVNNVPLLKTKNRYFPQVRSSSNFFPLIHAVGMGP